MMGHRFSFRSVPPEDRYQRSYCDDDLNEQLDDLPRDGRVVHADCGEWGDIPRING